MSNPRRCMFRKSGALAAAVLAGSLLCTGAAFCAEPLSAEAVSEPAMVEPQREDLGFKLPEGQSIDVDNPYGSVFVRFGGYEHQFDVHVTLQQPDGATKIDLAHAARDGRFRVAATLPEGIALAEGQRMDLVIYVPQKHAVSVKTDGGSIESRGVKSDLDLHTASGDIAVRGTDGAVQASTDDGKIEVQLKDPAPAGSTQKLVSRTGSITLGVSDDLAAELQLSTSAQFATDFSLQVEHFDGKEPNKRATTTIGTPKSGGQVAKVVLESLVGEIRLLRRAVFVDSE